MLLSLEREPWWDVPIFGFVAPARAGATSGPPWEDFRCYLPCSWLLLAAPGYFSLFLAAPGCSWLLLAAPGSSWLLLAAPGCFWLLASASAWSWLFLAAPGCFWPLLAVSGRLRLLLGVFGVFCINICKFHAKLHGSPDHPRAPRALETTGAPKFR